MLDNTVAYLISAHKFNNKNCKLPDLVPPDYVRVQYKYCGICGGDYSRFLGYRNSYPVSLGHEFVAQVLDINCAENLNYAVGDYVVSDFNYRCMKCPLCLKNESHLCEKNDIGLFSNRAFSQYGDIHYSYLVKTSIPSEYIFRATNIEPLSCIVHAMDHYNLSEISSVLIYGTGNIGMLCAFYLSCCKGKTVYVFDQNNIKQKLVSDSFSCTPINSKMSYDLVIEATNNPWGLLQCIDNCNSPKNICSFSHLYGQNTNNIYDKLVKNECNIFFPLRNGSIETLNRANDEIACKWEKKYDQLVQIYKTNNLNFPFEDKHKCNKPKQVIEFIKD